MTRRATLIAPATALLTGVIAVGVASLTSRGAPSPPFVMFRTLAPYAAYGRVAIVPIGAASTSRYITPLSCVRVHYAAASGICIVEEPHDRTVVHAAYTFDRRFVRRHRIALAGIPVRVRMSPTGHLAAITVYAEEESPGGERLATESVIIDVESGRVLADLREFTLNRGDASAIPSPIDITSVTFRADGDRFYASLVSGGDRYLLEGLVRQRALTIVRRGIANEALSPNGRLLAAKRRVGERGYWQVTVIDLATWTERDLNQGPRSVDDQVDWFDDTHVMYHDAIGEGTGIWKLSIDGRSGPQLVVRDAFSPAMQR